MKKHRSKKHLEKLQWIGDLSDADEEGIENTMEDWAAHIRAKGGWEAGRWRQTTVSYAESDLSAQDVRKKTGGALHLQASQWNLFYYKGEGPTIEELVESFKRHPLFGVGRWEEVKEEGHWDMDRGGIWVVHDHLSTTNYSARTRCNFSLTMGHTKNRDGAPEKDGRQMSHAWMKLLGNDTVAGDWGNLQIVANLLCELAGFDYPYPIFSRSWPEHSLGSSAFFASVGRWRHRGSASSSEGRWRCLESQVGRWRQRRQFGCCDDIGILYFQRPLGIPRWRANRIGCRFEIGC